MRNYSANHATAMVCVPAVFVQYRF